MDNNMEMIKEETIVTKKQVAKRQHLIMAVVVLVAVAIIGIVITTVMSKSKQRQLAYQLNLGQKYLEDMDYDQAILAFNKAIEIDPKNVEAYLGLVEAYIGKTDLENALEVAKKGYEITGNERLKEIIDMMEEDVGNVQILENFSDDDNLDTESDNGLKVATNLRWSDDKPGTAEFHNPNEENVYWVLHPYKGINSALTTYSGTISGEDDVCDISIYRYIMDSGMYTFKVELFKEGEDIDYNLSNGCVSEESIIFDYQKPSEQLDTPEGISVSSEGNVSWNPVENAECYMYYLYYAEPNDINYEHKGYTQLYGWIAMNSDNNCQSPIPLSSLDENRDYYIRVRAISPNINIWANSEYSDYIPLNISD